jgi:ribose 5-phosphate isomerase A
MNGHAFIALPFIKAAAYKCLYTYIPSATDYHTLRSITLIHIGWRCRSGAQAGMTHEDVQAAYKQQAALAAVALVESGMRVGLGTGSTAIYATRRIAARIRAGELRGILGYATSQATADTARILGIPLMADDLPYDLDISIDGADEIDPQLNVIKGGGGALLREKIVAQASRRYVIVADDRKLSPCLGTRHTLPVEVLVYGWRSQARYLQALGAQWQLRLDGAGAPYVTDSGNTILDCDFGSIHELDALATQLQGRAGIIQHGLFLGLASDVFVAGSTGIQHLRPH